MNHSSCLEQDGTFWCPTKLNYDSEPIKGFWGKCNIEEGKTNCDPNWTPPPDPDSESQTDVKTKGIFVMKIIIVYAFITSHNF